ncbi:sensor domain-containing diguanylate cyclase [Bacillus massiliigorillae]|uniref:sensor domain-containing diguanylate cyclase n=1 Tax=Bacillus massiliigorillae TaxID=1243664 RepID=UPI0003AA9AF5|nr:diguanylate cyclase [Bacillus massiliigorillae]
MLQHEKNGKCSEDILARMPGGICRCLIQDTQYKFEFVNKGFLNLLGCSSDELESTYYNDLLQVVHDYDRNNIEKDLNGLNEKEDDSVELQFRLARQDDKVVWVHAICNKTVDVNEVAWLNCIITDITSLKVSIDELKLREAGYFKITEHMNEILFEWDLIQDTLQFSSNFVEKFGYEPIVEKISLSVPTSMHIHPEDVVIFSEAFNSIYNGAPDVQCELRIKQYPDKYIWCKIRITSQFDENGHIFKAFGTISDIDDQKQTMQKLLFKAQRDSLTGIYNKATTQNFIEECLTGDDHHKNHALFIIDIDNFKHVNDQLGHLFGDAVLKDTAHDIQHLFRDSDIVGRIGGDEFMVFLKDIPSEDLVIEKSKLLMDVFRRSFTGRNKDYKISGSVGVAIYPRDGKTFNELFQNADNALYAAKKQGKDCFCIFSQELKAEQYKSVLDQVNVDDQSQMSFTENLKEYIFNILYETKDINVAIPLILEIVGKYYGVSRVYVFENSEDDFFVSNTFEWCNEGVKSGKDHLQNLSYSIFYDGEQSYQSLFDEKGIFYCQDIKTLPKNISELFESRKICSVLQCAMDSEGVFKGFVGFDECSGLRLWTLEEIDMLTVISHILATFLLKKRSEKELEGAYEFQKSILDHINTAIYAINPETFEIFYFNDKTKEMVPNLKLNDLCYKVFWDRQTPCLQCPMYELNTEKSISTLVLDSEKVDVSSNITAAYINWKYGKQCCILSRYDFQKIKDSNKNLS